MTTTNTKADAMTNANLRKGNARRILRRNCKHESRIECSDFAVCTVCEAVLK